MCLEVQVMQRASSPTPKNWCSQEGEIAYWRGGMASGTL